MSRRARGHALVESVLRSLDEMGHFPSEAARRRAVDEHIKSASRPWDLAIGIGVLAAAVAGTYFGLKFALPRVLPGGTSSVVEDVIRIGAMVGVYIVVLRALHRFGATTELRRRLVEEGVPVCLRCGYLLRGLPAGTRRCPECGRALGARIRSLLAPEAAAGRSAV